MITRPFYFFCSVSLGGSGFGVGNLNYDGLEDDETQLDTRNLPGQAACLFQDQLAPMLRIHL